MIRILRAEFGIAVFVAALVGTVPSAFSQSWELSPKVQEATNQSSVQVVPFACQAPKKVCRETYHTHFTRSRTTYTFLRHDTHPAYCWYRAHTISEDCTKTCKKCKLCTECSIGSIQLPISCGNEGPERCSTSCRQSGTSGRDVRLICNSV